MPARWGLGFRERSRALCWEVFRRWGTLAISARCVRSDSNFSCGGGEIGTNTEYAHERARPRAGYRACGMDGGGCDSSTALAPAEANLILLCVCWPIMGEISPQIAVTKPGVLRKIMSSEVEG